MSPSEDQAFVRAVRVRRPRYPILRSGSPRRRSAAVRRPARPEIAPAVAARNLADIGTVGAHRVDRFVRSGSQVTFANERDLASVGRPPRHELTRRVVRQTNDVRPIQRPSRRCRSGTGTREGSPACIPRSSGRTACSRTRSLFHPETTTPTNRSRRPLSRTTSLPSGFAVSMDPRDLARRIPGAVVEDDRAHVAVRTGRRAPRPGPAPAPPSRTTPPSSARRSFAAASVRPPRRGRRFARPTVPDHEPRHPCEGPARTPPPRRRSPPPGRPRTPGALARSDRPAPGTGARSGPCGRHPQARDPRSS